MKTVQVCDGYPPTGKCGGDCLLCQFYAVRRAHDRLQTERYCLKEKLRKLINAVKTMREAQQEYFRFRTEEWLNRAKRAERQVDKMLKADLEVDSELPLA